MCPTVRGRASELTVCHVKLTLCHVKLTLCHVKVTLCHDETNGLKIRVFGELKSSH